MDPVQESVDAIEQEINAELSAFLGENEPVKASNHCFNRILELGNESGVKDFNVNIRRYLYTIQMLQLQIETKHLRPHELEKVLRIAESSLAAAGIKENSRRGYLYEEIYNCKSNLLQLEGRPAGAQWELLIGKRFLSTDIVWINSAISETIALFHMGYAYEAKCGFERLLEYRMDKEQMVFLELQAIKAARLAGCLDDAVRIIERVKLDQTLKEKTRELIDWEATWLNMAKSGDIEPFSKMLGSGHDFPDEPFLSLIYLLYHAHPDGLRLLKNLPSLATIRRRYPKKLAETDKPLFEALELFQLLYDEEISVKSRLSKVTDSIDRITILNPEYQLLYYLGLARWAHRCKQKGFVSLALNKYRVLSYTMSNRRSDDVLAMTADLPGDGSVLWYLNEKGVTVEPREIRTMSRHIGRRFKVWTNWAKLGWQLIASDKSPQELAAAFTETILNNFIASSEGAIGPYAKSLQLMSEILSTLLHLTPKLTNEFAEVYCAIPPENAIDLAAVFQREFGKKLSDVFSSWENLPFDGGSISQVFRARLKDGRDAAIKVKHPDIEATARRDFDNVRKWVQPILRRFSDMFSSETFHLVETLFMNELNFERELEMMIKFRATFADDPRVIIPEPFVEHCSHNCITMEYIEGDSFADLCVEASQEQKDAIGVTMFRFHLKAFLLHNLSKQDYFSSNFRFAGERVVFLDFGRIVGLEEKRFHQILAGTKILARDPGSFRPNLPPEDAIFQPAAYQIFDSYLAELFTATEPTLIIPDFKGFSTEVGEIFMANAPKMNTFNFANHQEYEGLIGIMIILTKLGARHTWNAEFLKVMQECGLLEQEEARKAV